MLAQHAIAVKRRQQRCRKQQPAVVAGGLGGAKRLCEQGVGLRTSTIWSRIENEPERNPAPAMICVPSGIASKPHSSAK